MNGPLLPLGHVHNPQKSKTLGLVFRALLNDDSLHMRFEPMVAGYDEVGSDRGRCN
jgi:hypothetical protein